MKRHLFIIFAFLSINLIATEHIVQASNFSYSPSELNISTGDTVTWIISSGNHDVNGEFNSITGDPFNNPESFNSSATNIVGATILSFQFTLAGTYNYDCSVGSHAANGMVGTINVTPSTVVDVIVDSDNHNTLETAVIEAGLVEALSAEGPFTVFAPTDAAFDALPDGLLDELLADPMGELANILKYHVHGGLAMSTDLENGMMVSTLQGTDLTVTIDNNGVMINNAMVTMADVEADNGVVHIINAVLVPEDSYTVVDVIVDSDNHNTLETAVIEAGLVEALSAEGPFTVFAPTDAAFDALPDGLLDELLADPMGELANILKYHVHGGLAMSTDLENGMMVSTLQGTDLTVTIDNNGVMINNAMVTMADVEADNGVVHIINAVLVPELSSLNTFTIDNNKNYLYSINMLGERVDYNTKDMIIIDVYSNGKTIKKFNTNHKN